MLGVPVEHEDRFTEWVVKILQEGLQNIERSRAALEELMIYSAERIAEHRTIPEGERPDDLLDTTWSCIGSGLWHLATHPEDQQRRRDEPEPMDTALEEILRMYSPVTVTMARYVTEDLEFNGSPMKEGTRSSWPSRPTTASPSTSSEPTSS